MPNRWNDPGLKRHFHLVHYVANDLPISVLGLWVWASTPSQEQIQLVQEVALKRCCEPSCAHSRAIDYTRERMALLSLLQSQRSYLAAQLPQLCHLRGLL